MFVPVCCTRAREFGQLFPRLSRANGETIESSDTFQVRNGRYYVVRSDLYVDRAPSFDSPYLDLASCEIRDSGRTVIPNCSPQASPETWKTPFLNFQAFFMASAGALFWPTGASWSRLSGCCPNAPFEAPSRGHTL